MLRRGGVAALVLLSLQLRACLAQTCGSTDVVSAGATGGGWQDDTNAFLRVENDASAGVIFIPAGTYRIAQSIQLNKPIIAAPGAVLKVLVAPCWRAACPAPGSISCASRLEARKRDRRAALPGWPQVEGTLTLYNQPQHPYSLFFTGERLFQSLWAWPVCREGLARSGCGLGSVRRPPCAGRLPGLLLGARQFSSV